MDKSKKSFVSALKTRKSFAIIRTCGTGGSKKCGNRNPAQASV